MVLLPHPCGAEKTNTYQEMDLCIKCIMFNLFLWLYIQDLCVLSLLSHSD